MKNDSEEIKKRNELSEEYQKEIDSRKDLALSFFDEKTKEFIDTNIEYPYSYYGKTASSAVSEDFYNGLRSGKYSSPSEYIKKKLPNLTNGYILPRFKDMFYYSLDNVNNYQYAQDSLRRSFRTKDYSAYMENIYFIIHNFSYLMLIDADLCDILTRNVNEKANAYIDKRMESWSLAVVGYCEEAIAYELDSGNERLEEILTDIINGEGKIALNTTVIRGILMSRSEKMHELLCKLLLAAKLQEGLRQAICENADCGTVPAFMKILKVITENDLIRFSSVKRAVGTWTGIINDDTKDIERISAKTLMLINDCLSDEKKRENYYKSEDSMEIYTALWAYAFFEAKDAVKMICETAKSGTHHQLLTAGYFVQNLDDENFAHRLAAKVISERSEPDIMAVYLPHFMIYWNGKWSGRYKETSDRLSVETYFENDEEAEKYYDRLWELYDIIPKKSLDFSPCIFPWYSASLKKSDIAAKLCIIAWMLYDDEKLDKCCALIKECDSSDRGSIILYTLRHPNTPVQKKVFTECLADKDSYNRSEIFKMAEKTDFDESNYLQMEDMLKYKAADIRSNLIKLLCKQSDDKLYETAKRLISDKKEEKRTAGLDIIMQLGNDPSRKNLYEKCRPLAVITENTTAKEKILIGQINKPENKTEPVRELYSEDAEYSPVIPEEYIKKAEETFFRYLPERKNTDFKEVLDKLIKLIDEHIDDEYVDAYSGSVFTLGAHNYFRARYDGEKTSDIPFRDLWEDFYRTEIKSPELLYRTRLYAVSDGSSSDFGVKCAKIMSEMIGGEFTDGVVFKHFAVVHDILDYLFDKHIDSHDQKLIAAYVINYLINHKESIYVECTEDGEKQNRPLITYLQAKFLISPIGNDWREDVESVFPLRYKFEKIHGCEDPHHYYRDSIYVMSVSSYSFLDAEDYIMAAYKGVISEEIMYKIFFTSISGNIWHTTILDSVLETVSLIYSCMREYNSPVSSRNNVYSGRVSTVFRGLTEKDSPSELTEEDKKFVAFCENIYTVLTDTILSAELNRGDTATKYTKNIKSIKRIYGLKYFIAILTALGKDTLERSSYYGWGEMSKKSSLSYLLSVCIPDPEDSAEKLREMLDGTDITEKRIIEAALYSPEWLDIVGEYLNWEGFRSACYYFMAHMNESFDDKKKAIIAKYTPLSDEELNLGAFDIDWFRSAYEAMGEKRFGIIYDSAKYISDGTKHSRARKYADAVLGKLNAEATMKTISEKRNKDLLMAYALIPIKDEDDLFARYLYIQKFLKESKKFGSQRSASEKKACEMSMRNLALNAGYADVTRLTLRMETKLIDDSKDFFTEKNIDDITVKLSVDESGKSEIICTKGGKTLKSVPAKLKKNEYILALTQTKKNLTEQYRRTKIMFEQAMEDSTEFTVSEMKALRENPVALPVIKDLVFVCGKKIGFLDKNKLTDYSGKTSNVKDDEKVITAHPFALYKDGHWADYQKYLFERKIVQPFKQVFRELYVKTPEESEMNHSLRYAGNQIQPAKTAACLKSRRWVADVEDGLQKVYYKENIVARIYSMADWFSPADIEAPTLEWVEFSDRKTGRSLTVKDIPDIIFSEVMRDVDMAVSVAHAGGVDPETSHSTIEMRAALLEFTLPLFKLSNVEIKGSHAHIKGKLADYTLHLGSGVIHKKGGTMLAVLPVHSAHRGKLFLPFADDDPKTAEIITKVLFFAEDDKIKDPYILNQIK